MPDTRTPPIEIELKLAVSRRDLPLLRRRLACFGDGEITPVDNVYFDTTERLLAQHGMALRVRRIGRRWLQTLKTEVAATALSHRGEWEVPAPRGRLDLRRFPETPLTSLLGNGGQKALAPVFRTRFTRTIWQVRERSIEVVLDEGEIVAGTERWPILELELELKAGPAEALWDLALELAGGSGHTHRRAPLALLPAAESKAARGYRLAAGALPRPVKANAKAITGAISRKSTLAEALRSVVECATTVLLANAAGLSESNDPELIHQARVALRRLRSAARLLRQPAAWPRAFDVDLRWIARALGAARDWDVLQQQTLPALSTALPDWPPAPRLITLVQRQRQRHDQALQVALSSPRLARLALQLLQWAHAPAPPASASIADAARKRLHRLQRRLMRSAAFFVALSLPEQHRVRIRAKRMRYAVDLFSAALPAKRAARFTTQLANLQDELGALNDAAVGAARLSRLTRGGRIDLTPALQWFSAQRQEHALRAETALAELARQPAPWR